MTFMYLNYLITIIKTLVYFFFSNLSLILINESFRAIFIALLQNLTMPIYGTIIKNSLHVYKLCRNFRNSQLKVLLLSLPD